MTSVSTTDTKNEFSTVTTNIFIVVAGNGWGGSSIDVEALWRVAASCGTDVLPGTRDVKKATRTITWDWWRLFGYKAAFSATEAKLHQVYCYMCCIQEVKLLYNLIFLF
jgi:hypothetical protein